MTSPVSASRLTVLAAALLLPLGVHANTGVREASVVLKAPDSPMPYQPFLPNAVLIEDFNVVTAGCVANWTCAQNSNPLGVNGWFQGVAGNFPAQAGAPTAYISANFNSTAGATGVISNWLISPQVNFGTGAAMRVWTRTAGTGVYPDRLEIRLSSAGASTDVGATETSVGDFTTVLYTVNPSLQQGVGVCPPAAGPYPNAWCEISLGNIEGIPTSGSGRIAFRYFVTGAGPSGINSNLIGIDSFSYADDGAFPVPPNVPVFNQNFDAVAVPALPAGWTESVPTGVITNNWRTVTNAFVSAPNSVFATAPTTIHDIRLDSPTVSLAGTAPPYSLTFQRRSRFENNFDGLVLEISINAAPFVDAVAAGGSFSANGYNGTISASFGNPIGGRAAWTGATSTAFFPVRYELPPTLTAADTVAFRWRVGTDSSTSVTNPGAYIDDVVLLGSPIADLAAGLVAVPDPVVAGNSLTYTATATNNGPSEAQNVALSLTLPAGTAFGSATPSAGGNCAGTAPVVCTWPGITANAAVRSVAVVANVPPSATGPLSASVTVSSLTADLNAANNTAATNTAVNAEADLSITLTDAPDPAPAGTNVTYQVSVTNGGPSDAQGVNFSLPLPVGTSFVSVVGSAGAACNAATPVVCTWAGATAPGAPRTATVTALIGAGVANGTILSATATAASSTTDPVPGNNSATTTTTVNASANLSITLTDAPDPVTAGSNLTYTAVLSNAGPSDAQGANITLPLPVGTSFVSATAPGGSCNAVSPVVCTWAGATATGVNRTATVVVLVDAGVANGTVLSATATAASSTPDAVPGNNTATTTTTVNASANLALTITASTAAANLGEPVTFTTVSTNLGPSNAVDLQIVLTLSPDFRFSSAAPGPGGVCTTPQIGQSGPVSCTWAGPTAPGAARTLEVVAVSNAPGTSSIMATTSSLTSDPVTANNSASVSVLVGEAGLAIPSLDRYGLVLLGLLLGMLGLLALRQRV